MSGIIGSAGSKSGIIGLPTIENSVSDYEEGTWTPAPDVDALTEATHRWYKKIGNMVWLSASVTFGASSSTSTQKITGSPFTSLHYSSGYVGSSSWTTSGEPQLMVVIWNNDDEIYFYNRNEALTGANLAGSRVDFTIAITLT